MIEGGWHAQGSAKRVTAKLEIDGTTFTLLLADGTIYNGKISNLKVSDRLGNVARRVTLEDGSIFTTYENDAIDKHFKNLNSILHSLESHKGFVLAALVATLFTIFVFFKWGIPWTSKAIAHALPHKTNILIAQNSLKFLDKYIFEDSNLTEDKKEKIRQHFSQKLLPLSNDKEIKYVIHFRSWNDGSLEIPNALALPSGDIILTDKFVTLCKTDEEMDSVMLHEMGHVVHRHALESVIEGAFLSVILMTITGDSNGMADMGIGLGSLLATSSFSRDHESEADMYAFKKMLIAKMDPAAFSTIMERMTEYIKKERQLPLDKNNNKKSQKNIFDYLSSHPKTEQRIEVANHYSDCFKQKLTICPDMDELK